MKNRKSRSSSELHATYRELLTACRFQTRDYGQQGNVLRFLGCVAEIEGRTIAEGYVICTMSRGADMMLVVGTPVEVAAECLRLATRKDWSNNAVIRAI